MNAAPIRLLIADDHYIVLMGMLSLLRLEEDVSVIATAESGAETVALYREHHPDVALVDLRMPDMDGIQVTEKIREEFPEARILILTSFDYEQDVHLAIKAGVRGYMLKDAKGEELMDAIRTVSSGKQWLPHSIRQLATAHEGLPDLSPRQVEVLNLVAKGLTNKEIANVLGFTENGTKQHLRIIYEKLGVATRTEAASEALRRAILRTH